MRKLAALVMFFLITLLAVPVQAQYGKNIVKWQEIEWSFYRSEHADFYVALDLQSEEIQPHFNILVQHIENSYEFLSAKLQHRFTKNRPIIVVTQTHWQFEALSLSGGDMSEGIGAYAFPRMSKVASDTDLILVVKPDFLPKLNQTIYTHELGHLFQFDMMGATLIQRLTGRNPIDHWIYEATADYMADNFAPYTTDEIRKIDQRAAAANVKNPQFGLPTLEMCQFGYANPYVECEMIFGFLESLYGEDRVFKLIADIFKSKKRMSFLEWLEELSKGEFSAAEAFDRAHRDYWIKLYGEDSLRRPEPYSDTDSVEARQISKQPYPAPFKSPVVSRDGKYVAFLTANRKSGVVIAIADALPKEDPSYIPKDKKKRQRFLGGQPIVKPGFKVITEYIPPKPYEYIVGQKLETWTFNGSDIDWWQDEVWISDVKMAEDELKQVNKDLDTLRNTARDKKELPNSDKVNIFRQKINELQGKLRDLKALENVNRIIFFARYNRDHALFIKDVNTGKLSKPIEIPLDQGFSPKFSLDGKTVYFSAAKNISRNIYSLNLETRELAKLTDGAEAFNSAPSISPDGTKIAYVAFPKGSDFQKLFLLDLTTGVKTQLTYGPFNDNSPSWSSDGVRLVYTSDEKDNIWNLYTYEIENKIVKQWTEIPGGVFTPVFYPGGDSRVVFSGFFYTDQFRSFIFSNFKLFEHRLKEQPLRVVYVEPSDENMQIAFRSENIINKQLDQRQIQHPDKPPARWKFYGNSFQAGYSGFYGGYIFTQFAAQDLLADKTHVGIYAQNGFFRYIDYTFFDSSRRWTFAANANVSRYPLTFGLYNYNGGLPKYPEPYEKQNQFILNRTWSQEMSATLFAKYPFNKWDGVELGLRLRQRKFILPLEVPADQREYFESTFPPIDVRFYDIFSNASNQTNLGLLAAFSHDTVSYSNEAGPLNGFAFRGQAEYGPGLNAKSSNYATVSFDARRYFRLANSTLAAFRGMGMKSTRSSGDYMLLGGSDTLPSSPYFSIAGNEGVYGRADLRFPFADIVLGGVIPFDVRGVLFADAARIKFSQNSLPAQNEWSYGLAFQTRIFLPLEFGIARNRLSPNKFVSYIRVGMGF